MAVYYWVECSNGEYIRPASGDAKWPYFVDSENNFGQLVLFLLKDRWCDCSVELCNDATDNYPPEDKDITFQAVKDFAKLEEAYNFSSASEATEQARLVANYEHREALIEQLKSLDSQADDIRNASSLIRDEIVVNWNWLDNTAKRAIKEAQEAIRSDSNIALERLNRQAIEVKNQLNELIRSIDEEAN